jgi:hypothetical protein
MDWVAQRNTDQPRGSSCLVHFPGTGYGPILKPSIVAKGTQLRRRQLACSSNAESEYHLRLSSLGERHEFKGTEA